MSWPHRASVARTGASVSAVSAASTGGNQANRNKGSGRASSQNHRSSSGGAKRSNARNRPSSQRPRPVSARVAEPISAPSPSAAEPGPTAAFEVERQRNRRWHLRISLLWAILSGVVVGGVLCVLSIPIGLIAGLVLGLALFGVLWRVAPKRVAVAVKARRIDSGQLPRVDALLGGLSVTMGVTTPLISLLDDPVPNAAIISVGGAPTVVLTTGLLEVMTVVQLEGVLGHLLAHERLDAVDRGTAGAGMALLLGPLGRSEPRARRLIGRDRLFQADGVAALAVRYPPGLAGALKIMEQASSPAPGSFFASATYGTLRWLFVDPSIGRRAASDSMGDVDATVVRRLVLEEL